MNRRHLLIIVILSVLITIVLQLNLTRAILFRDYLRTDDIVLGREDRAYYLVLINESSKGNWELGSPFLKEWGEAPYLYPALNVNALGFLKKVSGTSIKSYFIILDYAAVLVLMILAITLFLVMFRWENFGYIAGISYVLLPRMLIWDRTISPQTNFIPLLLFLIFYFSRMSGIKREIALGASAGVLFYVYPYYWTFTVALLVIGDVWEFFKNKKFIWERLYKYLIILAIIPYYLIHMLNVRHLSYYEESIRRIGALYSRLPSGFYTQAVILSLIIIFLFLRRFVFRKNNYPGAYFQNFEKIILGLVASVIVLNQQIVTGMQLEFNSHYLPVIIIFMVGVVAGMFFVVIGQGRFRIKLVTAGGIAVAMVFFSNAILYQVRNNHFSKKENYLTDDALKTLNWFKENEVRDSVIYSPPELSNKILLLTNNYLYFHPAQELHLMPTSELVYRFTYSDITNQDITSHPENYQLQIFGQIFNSIREKDNVVRHIKAVISGQKFVPAPLDEKYLRYDFKPMRLERVTVTPPKLDSILGKYHVNYVVYSIRDKNSIYKNIPGKIVFENSSYLIKAR
ncbi:MAG TPA: hypothetical protein VJJ73_02525 [Candidatus Paceibacterota bacterium]